MNLSILSTLKKLLKWALRKAEKWNGMEKVFLNARIAVEFCLLKEENILDTKDLARKGIVIVELLSRGRGVIYMVSCYELAMILKRELNKTDKEAKDEST